MNGVIEMLNGHTNEMTNQQLAELADWADHHAKEVSHLTWKRAYALIREGADLLLRRRSLAYNVDDSTRVRQKPLSIEQPEKATFVHRSLVAVLKADAGEPCSCPQQSRGIVKGDCVSCTAERKLRNMEKKNTKQQMDQRMIVVPVARHNAPHRPRACVGQFFGPNCAEARRAFLP